MKKLFLLLALLLSIGLNGSNLTDVVPSLLGDGEISISAVPTTGWISKNGIFYKVLSEYPSATGGIETTEVVDGVTYKVHTFKESSAFIVSSDANITAEVLLVAGGGAGGTGHSNNTASGAGGGAGGLLHYPAKTLSAGTYQMVIGLGGTPVSSWSGTGGKGGDTTGFDLIAVGGGGGSCYQSTGATGGSGGGSSSGTGGAGTATQGNNGGSSVAFACSGGGGGAGGVGSIGGSGAGGNGGVGLHFPNLTTGGSPAGWFAGGGGGSANTGGTLGTGGTGGGGDSAADASNDGVANTGSGGGGRRNDTLPGAGAGGKGIVIIRYAVAQ